MLRGMGHRSVPMDQLHISTSILMSFNKVRLDVTLGPLADQPKNTGIMRRTTIALSELRVEDKTIRHQLFK